MKTYSIDELLLASKPTQFSILERLIGIFSGAPAFARGYVRGSIANQNFDRASDVDFVAVFDDIAIPDLNAVIHSIMKSHFNIILPPWHDTIVPDFGGSGYVYLAEVERELFSIDLYVLPLSKTSRFECMAQPKLIFERKAKHPPEKASLDICQNHDFLASIPLVFPKENRLQDTYVEIITISFLLLKRIRRNQHFLNYAETHLIHKALSRLVRAIYDPDHLDYGWYLLDGHAKDQRIPHEILMALKDIIRMNPISDLADVGKKLAFATKLLQEADPKTFKDMALGIEFFQKYFHLGF